LKGDGKGSVWEMEPTTKLIKCYSHRMEFSEICMELHAGEINFGGLVRTLAFERSAGVISFPVIAPIHYGVKPDS